MGLWTVGTLVTEVSCTSCTDNPVDVKANLSFMLYVNMSAYIGNQLYQEPHVAPFSWQKMFALIGYVSTIPYYALCTRFYK